MNFYITKKVLVFVILALCALLFWIFITGCGSPAGLRPPGTGAASVSTGPAGVLTSLALFATWASGVGLFLCGIAAALPVFPNKLLIGRLAICCLAGLLTAGIMHWIAGHWALIVGLCIGVLVLCGIGWVYLNRRYLEKKTGVDLNRDGRIG